MLAEISWRAARSGTAHGFVVWFESELIDGVSFSNRPGTPETIYGNGLFPFSEPVALNEGDQIRLQLGARMVKGDYVWRWDTCFERQKVNFKQSTFFGVPLSSKTLRQDYRIEQDSAHLKNHPE